MSASNLASATAVVTVPLAQGTMHTFVLEYFNGWAEYVRILSRWMFAYRPQPIIRGHKRRQCVALSVVHALVTTL